MKRKNRSIMENNVFSYNYSAHRNKEVESIRKKYMPHEESKFERLKKLDLRVQTAGTVEALCLGIIGVLIYGVGICFLLKVFTGAYWIAALLMILGSIIMIPAYPLYRKIAKKTKAELTPEILRLSEEIMNSQKNYN